MWLSASVQEVFTGLSNLSESILSLTVLTECKDVHQHYSTALNGLCHNILYALSPAIFVILFTLY